MNNWVLLALAVLGFVFVAGGVGRVWRSWKSIWRWLGTRGGEIVEAEIIDRRMHSPEQGPSVFYGTLRWLYGNGEHIAELQIPKRWYGLPKGDPVDLRINPNRPDIAVIEHWTGNPTWKLLGLSFGLVVAVLGLGMLLLALGNAFISEYQDCLNWLPEPFCQTLASLGN